MPKKQTVYDFMYVKKHNGSWASWSSFIENTEIPSTAKPSELLINTVETVRQAFFLKMLLDMEKMVLFVGPTGTGKSAIINSYLHKLPREKFVLFNLNFSARTTASQTQEIVMSRMTRHKKGIYGPANNRKGIIFVDDLNMPLPEKYGAQPPIELLRNLADHRFWYDR